MTSPPTDSREAAPIVSRLPQMPPPRTFVPEPARKTREGLDLEVHVLADLVPGSPMLKRAFVQPNVPTFGAFEIYCDEGAAIGGTDAAPAPLSYLAAGVAFCFLTHLKKYAEYHELKISSIRLEQRMKFQSRIPGATSDMDGQMEGRSKGLETCLLIETEESQAAIERMVDVAERACMAAQTVVNAIPSRTRIRLEQREDFVRPASADTHP